MSVVTLGQGNYQIQLQLSMAGPWEIRVVAQAPGYDLSQQVLFVQVVGRKDMSDETFA